MTDTNQEVRETVLVPLMPTEAQWGGLARDIVQWWCFDVSTGRSLYLHLKELGRPVPDWLHTIIRDVTHVPAKGDVATAIYRAMIASAPPPAVPDAVGVRAVQLTWEEPSKAMNMCWTAKSVFGTYSVVNEDGWYATLDGAPWGKGFEWSSWHMQRDTLYTAQAAAQADFDRRILSSIEPTPSPEPSWHADDIAVDRFAVAMKAKLAEARKKGKGGWYDETACSQAFLSEELRGHALKADPIDVANFAMFLHQRGETIAPAPSPEPDTITAATEEEILVGIDLASGLSPEPQAAGCMCRDVPIGSHKVSVLMELPEHMASVRVARVRDGLSPYITIDSCLVEEIRDLWSKGITTTGCCCGHNRAQGFIGVASQDIHAMKAMGYLVAPNASRPGAEDIFVPKSIRSEPQASNAVAVEALAALTTPEPQTGEWDKAIHDLAKAIALGHRSCDDDGDDLEVFRQAFFALDAVEQMLIAERKLRTDFAAAYGAERAAREVAERERDKAREGRGKIAAEADHYRLGFQTANDRANRLDLMLEELAEKLDPHTDENGVWCGTVVEAALAVQAERDAAERRLAEVEERAREDERDRLLSLAFDHTISTHPYSWKSWAEGAKCWIKDNGAMFPSERAALRAKPEAQAIGGKEAGE